MRRWLRRYREESKGRRGRDKVTAAVPESEPAAPAAPDPREVPVEPDPNPKRRLHLKSASSTASGSGQQREKGPIPDNAQVYKLETRRKWALVKAQRCPEHRQQTPDEELL